MNIDRLYAKYCIHKNNSTDSLIIDKYGFTKAITEIISNPVEADVKPANGDTIKTIKEFFDDYLLDKDNCFYIDSIKFKNNINFAALILLQAKIDLLSRLSV